MLNNVFTEYGCIHCKSFCLIKASSQHCPLSSMTERTRKYSIIELVLMFDQRLIKIISCELCCVYVTRTWWDSVTTQHKMQHVHLHTSQTADCFLALAQSLDELYYQPGTAFYLFMYFWSYFQASLILLSLTGPQTQTGMVKALWSMILSSHVWNSLKKRHLEDKEPVGGILSLQSGWVGGSTGSCVLKKLFVGCHSFRIVLSLSVCALFPLLYLHFWFKV